MIIIHAHIKVSENKRETFLGEAQELIKHTRSEEGNISYQLFEDASQPNSFIMVEKWKDQEATRAHNESVHFNSFLEKAKDLLAEPLQADLFEATKL